MLALSLTHLSPELNLEAASNPRQHFICSLVISLPFGASSLQFFPPFPLSFAALLLLVLPLLGLVNEPKRVFVSGIERSDPGLGRVRCASSAAWLEFVCQYVGATQSLCWWLCCSRFQRQGMLLAADWVRGQMRGRYCLLPWGICVRASGREEATHILQGLRIFPRFYYCVWLMLQVRWVCMCVWVCMCLCESIKTTIIVIHTPQTNTHTHRHTLLWATLVHKTFNYKHKSNPLSCL